MGRPLRIVHRHGYLRGPQHPPVHGRRFLRRDALLPGCPAGPPLLQGLVHHAPLRLLQAGRLEDHRAGRGRQVQHRRLHDVHRHLLRVPEEEAERQAPLRLHGLQRLPHRRRLPHREEGLRAHVPSRRPQWQPRAAADPGAAAADAVRAPPQDHRPLPHRVVLPEHELRHHEPVGEGVGTHPHRLHLRLWLRLLYVPGPLGRHPLDAAAGGLEGGVLPGGHAPAPGDHHPGRLLRHVDEVRLAAHRPEDAPDRPLEAAGRRLLPDGGRQVGPAVLPPRRHPHPRPGPQVPGPRGQGRGPAEAREVRRPPREAGAAREDPAGEVDRPGVRAHLRQHLRPAGGGHPGGLREGQGGAQDGLRQRRHLPGAAGHDAHVRWAGAQLPGLRLLDRVDGVAGHGGGGRQLRLQHHLGREHVGGVLHPAGPEPRAEDLPRPGQILEGQPRRGPAQGPQGRRQQGVAHRREGPGDHPRGGPRPPRRPVPRGLQLAAGPVCGQVRRVGEAGGRGEGRVPEGSVPRRGDLDVLGVPGAAGARRRVVHFPGYHDLPRHRVRAGEGPGPLPDDRTGGQARRRRQRRGQGLLRRSCHGARQPGRQGGQVGHRRQPRRRLHRGLLPEPRGARGDDGDLGEVQQRSVGGARPALLRRGLAEPLGPGRLPGDAQGGQHDGCRAPHHRREGALLPHAVQALRPHHPPRQEGVLPAAGPQGGRPRLRAHGRRGRARALLDHRQGRGRQGAAWGRLLRCVRPRREQGHLAEEVSGARRPRVGLFQLGPPRPCALPAPRAAV
mmetsp:Transcript_17883/g.56351  ORF Transcript_17883/g.56351 Transcript_17883/m.56351 type:complete len:781 (+) Transcript_17883:718-3060(+)